MGRTDELLQELQQLIRRKKITFQNGLLQSLNDSVNGFVSEFNNMEVNNMGVVSRRKGTRLISDRTKKQAWLTVKTVSFAGIPVVIAINYKREVYAFFEFWPEVEFKVRDASPFQKFFYYADSSSAKTFTSHMMFSRGSKFFINETNNFVDITNNFGETFRIDTVDYIRLDISKEPTQRKMLEDLENSRNVNLSDRVLAVYLNIKTIKYPKFDGIGFTGIKEEKFPRIDGSIRIAPVSDNSTIGDFGEELKIDVPKTGYISPFRVKVSDKGKVKMSGHKTKDAFTVGENDIAFRHSSSHGYYINHSDFNPTTNYDTEVLKCVLMAIDEPIGTSLDRGVYLFATDEATLNYAGTNGVWFQMSTNSRFIDNGIIAESNRDFVVRIESASTMTFMRGNRDNINFANYDGALNAKMTGDTTGSIAYAKLADVTPESFGDKGLKTIDYGSAGLSVIYKGAFCFVDLVCEYSSATLRVDETAVKSNTEFLIDSVILAKDGGFDNWEFNPHIPLLYNSDYVEEFNPNTNELTLDIPDKYTHIISNKDDQASNFLAFGSRFAIYNKGTNGEERILKISQRGTHVGSANDYSLTPSYSMPLQSDLENSSVSPIGLAMVYSPIASLEGISISSFPYDYKARRRTMSNPESVKYANSRMYFLEGTRLWSGSIDSLISDSSVDIAAKVVDIETFGCVIS